MTGIERSIIEVLAVLALVGGFALYEQHRGALGCRQADLIAQAQQEGRNAARAAIDTQVINREAIDHDQAISVAPDPTPALLCVRKYAAPRTLSQAATAPSLVATPADVRAADSGGFDPSERVKKVGQTANADMTRLQAYVREVCLAK